MFRCSTLACVLATTLACADARPQAESDTGRSASAKLPAPQAASASSGPVPYYLDPSEDCGFLKASVFPDPVALVKHYVALDNEGLFLQSTPAVDSLYVCPGHLPGPDEFTVVSRSDIAPLSATDSVARIVVRSRRLGTMTQDSVGFVFVRVPGVVVDTFVVLHTPFGWRIESPELPDRVLGSSVLTRSNSLRLRPEVRDSLKAAMSQPDG